MLAGEWFSKAMNEDKIFTANLAAVIAHSILLHAKGDEPMGEVWAVNSLFALLEKKPEVPKFKKTDTTKEQAAATAGNLQNFDAISTLAGKTNTFNQDQLNKMLESALPGYRSLQSSIGSKISDELSGKVPQDVIDLIKRNSAEKSVSGGFSGGGMVKDNLTARDLGRTSLDLVDKGIDAGTRWIQSAKSGTANSFDPSSMFVSPAQRIGVTMSNNENAFNRNWLSNQVDAAYDPMTIIGKGADSLVEGIKGAAASAAGSSAGGGSM